MSYNICDEPGPCWDGYVFIGPEEGKKGSCIKKDKLCKKTRGKGTECLEKIKCPKNIKKTKSPIKNKKKINNKAYNICLEKAQKRYDNKKLKLCPRGYCTAKHTFEVYPSAYANGYATGVCKGQKPDALGVTEEDKTYTSKFKDKKSKKKNPLNRWYREQWVNLCEKGDGPGGYAICGTGKGIDNPEKYPYCRAYYKLPGTKVVTAQDLTKQEIDMMCKKKRSLEQGIDGKPTRITLDKNIRQRVKNKRNRQKGGNIMVLIPKNVKKDAEIGNLLVDKGFSGGTETGWNRGIQLESEKTISIGDLADMRTWFARHGPDAKNGGTSYPGYCKWLDDGSPMDRGKSKYRGAVSWLIWGGNSAYKWLKTDKIRNLLEQHYPKRKAASPQNFLGCM